ncbi:MAG: NUDIX hydrolase [Caulobacteraceae bacterium]|nr:NUDIX hydrolase [Caulobacteraceae bacterium]
MTRITGARTAYQGYVAVQVVTLADADGALHQREVVSFGQSACVLPYDPDRKVGLIVRLPRAPLMLDGIETPLIEAPAGMIEAGETAEAAVIREAMEEVGVALSSVEKVAETWPSPGVIAERSHLFLAAYGAQDRHGPGGGLAHEHEGIVAEEMALAELWRLAAGGALQDMKTLTLVLALHARRPELFG